MEGRVIVVDPDSTIPGTGDNNHDLHLTNLAFSITPILASPCLTGP